jgi:hypothetical protein
VITGDWAVSTEESPRAKPHHWARSSKGLSPRAPRRRTSRRRRGAASARAPPPAAVRLPKPATPVSPCTRPDPGGGGEGTSTGAPNRVQRPPRPPEQGYRAWGCKLAREGRPRRGRPRSAGGGFPPRPGSPRDCDHRGATRGDLFYWARARAPGERPGRGASCRRRGPL